MDSFDDNDSDLCRDFDILQTINNILIRIESDEMKHRQLCVNYARSPDAWKDHAIKRKKPILIDLTRDPQQTKITKFMFKRSH